MLFPPREYLYDRRVKLSKSQVKSVEVLVERWHAVGGVRLGSRCGPVIVATAVGKVGVFETRKESRKKKKTTTKRERV